MFNFQCVKQKINHSYRHYSHGSVLPHGIAGKSHQQWEYRTPEQPHNHQSGYLVLLVGPVKQSLRENNGKYI